LGGIKIWHNPLIIKAVEAATLQVDSLGKEEVVSSILINSSKEGRCLSFLFLFYMSLKITVVCYLICGELYAKFHKKE
jgi:hypothetical protein